MSDAETTSGRANRKRDERAERLATALSQEGALHLREAAELLGVSEMTVRRDVASAPDRFIYLGAHIFLPPAPQRYRIGDEAASLTAAKMAASSHAFDLIRPGSTIFIDSGTTLLHLAALLPSGMDLTVVTGSLNVASRVGHNPGVRLVLTGGLYHPASDSFTNDASAELLSGIGINAAFMSASGFDAQRGASCHQFHELPIKKQVLASAVERYLVLDSSKLGQVQPAFFAKASDFTAIICETGPVALAGHG
jgi:DeoR family deoxyribose operon repressor